jgi:NAD(P)-dependent dehydrogenase (short-subunit alcohol dehydrogenase family)
MAGVVAMPFIGAYVASKFALEGIVDVMRREALPQGVNVTLVEPGGIKTPMVSEQLSTLKPDYESLNDEERQRYGYLYRGFTAMATKSHLEEASSPEEIARVVITALDDEHPQPRYIGGADAAGLIQYARDNTDNAVDEFFANAFAGAASLPAS